MNLKKFWKEAKHALAFVLAIALFFNGWTNYDFSVFAADELTVKLSSDSAVYTGSDLTPDVSVTDANGANVDVTAENVNVTWEDSTGNPVTEITDAGTYKVTVEATVSVDDGTGGYTDETHTGTEQFTVNVLDLSACTVDADEAAYTGAEIEPANVVVKLGDAVIDSSLYSIEGATDNVNAGTAHFTVNAAANNSNVTGSKEGSFTIAQKALTDDMVTIEPEGATVNGENHSSAIKVTVNAGTETALTEGTDYTVSIPSEIVSQGEYDITVSGIGNYSGDVTQKFTLSYATGGSASLDGNTLEDNVYADTVTVTPAEGYEIAEEAAGTYEANITYTATPSDFVVYLKNIATNEITEYQLPEFEVDTAAPVFNSVTEPDNAVWAASKEIALDVSGADDIYYTTTEANLGELISEKPTGMQELTGNILQIQENISEETTYYFYAIDKAGHVTAAQAKVNHVDVSEPAVSVGKEIDYFDEINGVYWKNSDTLEIPIEVSDEPSGIRSIEVTGLTETLQFTEGDKEAAGNLVIADAGDYEVTVTDLAGNDNSVTFTVKQDTKAPEVTLLEPTLSEPTGNKMYFDKVKQVYWFSSANVKVPLTVADGLGVDETEKSPYTVIYSISEDMSNPTGVTDITDDSANVSFELAAGETTYYFQVTDKAGNEGKTQSITLAFDESAPEIAKASLTQLNGDKWINAAELGEERKVAFSVEASDTGSGIQTIEYSPDGGTKYYKASVTEVNGVYTFVTNEEYPDGTGYQWKVRVTDNVGLCKEQEIADGQIDTTPPDTTAYIKFFSDTAGANDISNNNKRGSITDGKWTSKIWKIASDTWNKIWGRTKISFEVYVQDVTSGVDSIEMSYNGSPLTVKKEEGLKAFEEGDEAASNPQNGETGYTVFTGEITCNEGETVAIQNFRIDSMTDIAGNVTEKKVILGDAADKEMIYLDAVAPKLSAQITDSEGNHSETDIFTNERYFYNEKKRLVLTIEERFFGQEDNPVFPEVRVYCKNMVTGVSEENSMEIPTDLEDTKGWKNVGSNRWQAVVELPWEDGVEKEYQVKLESYADPSGNILLGDTGVTGVTDGAFESKIFVIDGITPKLTSYRVNQPTDCTVGGNAVYKNDTANDDLTVTFTIDDNETYYETSKENLLVNLYKNDETTPVKTLKVGDEDLSGGHTSGREYTYSFGYDGETATEDEFYVEISYQDAAKNPLSNGDNFAGVNDGKYISSKYIIDHVAPVFHISYSDATNVVDAEGKDADGSVKTPLANHTAYYKDNIDVTLTFDEKYVNTGEKGSLEHFEFGITKDGTTLETGDVPEITWSHNGTTHTAKFTIEADKTNHETDGNYQLTVKYRDCAENAMVGSEDNADLENLMSTENEITGVYTSPVLVMDTTAPIITTQYVIGEAAAEPNQTINGIDYFNDLNTAFQITVADRNIRYGELKTVLSGMEAYDINQQSIDGSALKQSIEAINETSVQCVTGDIDPTGNIWTLNLPLQTAANYKIPVGFADLAGNTAKVNGTIGTFTEYVTTDSTAPGLELSYSVTDPANYLKWGYLFAKGQLNITVTATDEISGIQYIKFTVTDENGKVTEKTGTFAATGNTTYAIDIPLATKDFKGSVYAEVIDYSTNTTNQIRGHIIESAEKHSATGKAVIQTLTSPSRTVGGVDFYNTDVRFKLTLEDDYSGLASWEYAGGDTLKNAYSYKDAVGTDLDKAPTQEITYSYVEELTLSAAGNNKNDVQVTASYVDNAGYTNEVEQKYNIDITKPEIEVTYDLNEPANGKYYKETRTATVRIRERNFDPADVEFLITSTDGPMPQISDWSSSGSGDDTWHTCTLAFAMDSDYTFTLKFQDMAGNVADYDRVDEFTIDKTIPVATVTYDNNNFLNEYYYDAARTATIDILEHNFDPSAIEIMITADGQTAGVPHISSWASNGDHNIATVTFSADAEYTFDIAGLDLALNELEDYEPDHFVIDQTPPELEIFDIENMSANNGVVRPGIRYHDTNYDKDGTVILMTGYHNGVVEMTGARKLEANGLELKLDDFAYVQEMDDLYTMHAEVYDLAGNSSEETVVFSVNRFGSVYTFDEKTDALIGDNGKYYTNREQELVITETNVDTLEFKEITCNLNGKLTTLKEGQDYTVSLNGNEATWKQYTYTIKEENFVEEGTYILTIYSEDRATNTSDNSSKGKKIEFVVDKTNPSVLISGVENNGQYRTNSREMTLDIEDNVRLASVAVTIDGVETAYDSAQIQEADGKFVMNIGSANHWQEIEVAVTDAAGNEEISEEMRVLVTANIFVQYFMNKPLFYGSLGTLAAIAALLWWFLVGKKKKENEEAK